MQMVLDESLISQVNHLKGALTVIHSATATNADRHSAQLICNQMQEQPYAPIVGRFLAHKDQSLPDFMRHFGLGMIEYAITSRWQFLVNNQQDLDALKGIVVDMLQNVHLFSIREYLGRIGKFLTS